ncbi:TPA: DNA polymerase I [Neisseria meningitidis]|uniref:DNA polymerase I n=1 Tax=Neisseria meningitidis TaxID=487 RepID=UPI0001FC0148|nr:DNA polymerase I [Neisseria meningitidis]EGC50333.1 DNA polymerase I [Neisseria meningitidis N1568]ELK63612.1 DNA polymerase I family protein [Neisseria meningitidis 97021]ELK70111.1 DNA polymerase I family protein [Neisseria meningitidis 2006087]ELK75386.1 DNA polymerase I family protein [Neisseria meningitidis 2002038]ELK76399.1 DNA polymerase I family protein [Neisseria meningitidis 97014]
MSNRPTLLLVDGSSYLYRAYHAMAQLTAPDGAPTGAMYGVLNMLRRLRADYVHDYCAVVFDAKGKNFRHEMFSDYKATRPPMPDDLRPQAEALPDLVRLTGWPVLVIGQVEADDVIGTLAKQGAEHGLRVIVSTGDKDMAQLVDERVTLVNTMSGETLDIEGVKAKFGVRPDQIRDYLALMGDKVDNVPGVEKCGPKTAVKWLEAYGSLQGVIEHAAEIKGKVGENLQAALPQLPLSYDLVTIKTDVDLHAELSDGIESLRRTTPKWAQLVVDFKRWGFRTWLKEAESNMNTGSTDDLFGSDSIGEQAALNAEMPFEKQAEKATAPEKLDYQAVTTEAQFAALLDKLSRADTIGIDTETTSLDAMNASLVGISIAFQAGEAVYIPVGHSLTAAPEQLDLQDVLGRLKPHLENPALKKIGQNLKYDQHVFANYGIALNGIAGDAMLASYIIESHLGHGLDELSERWLGLETITYESLCGKGAKQIGFADVAIEQATEYAAQDADFALRLEAHLRAQMDAKQLEMYEKMELPVAQVLFEMERNGVQIDRAELARQSAELGAELMKLEQEAYAAAGQPFNLNSPKQLQEILFDKMGIPTKGLKKTAKGGISTNEAVLEQLAPDYPLPKIILQNRSLAKLKSTYTDKLPEMISPKDGRVHTTYAQAVAITGRLASNNPNLQNIPIRTAEGRRVRRAFTAPQGSVIVSADYSQIELRIMAHLSGDKTLIAAFQNGEDVHRRTAAEVFGIAPENVSPEQRRYAKTINFGLIYGMGQYGLAKSLGIDNISAKNFIDRYFARYPGVAEYMQRTKEQAAAQGFVETLFGRRLYLPDIHNKNANARAGAERAAINAPMQGTASDLIKRAMIDVSRWLSECEASPWDELLQSKLIMQVHDELVLEVVETELDFVKEKLPQIMAKVGGGLLDVPLVAEVGVGENWEEAH